MPNMAQVYIPIQCSNNFKLIQVLGFFKWEDLQNIIHPEFEINLHFNSFDFKYNKCQWWDISTLNQILCCTVCFFFIRKKAIHFLVEITKQLLLNWDKICTPKYKIYLLVCMFIGKCYSFVAPFVQTYNTNS